MSKSLQFVTPEQAKKLKTLGFNWECYYFYLPTDRNLHTEGLDMDYNFDYAEDRAASAPTIALALKWCRDAKGIGCSVEVYAQTYYWCYCIEARWRQYGGRNSDTYEAAEYDLLNEVLYFLAQQIKDN